MEKDFSKYINFSKGDIVFITWRNETNWPVEYVTSSIKTILGYEPKELISGEISYADIIHKDDFKRVKEELINATNNNKKEYTHQLYRIKNANNVYKYIYDHTSIIRDEEGNVSHYEGYLVDQTDIILQKQRLELVLEGTQLGLWDWNPQTNEVFFDERWANMLGYHLDEIEPSLESWESKVHPDDLDNCYKDIKAHIEGKTKLYSNVHRMMHKDGSYRFILDRGKVVEKDEDRNPIRFTGTHTDITKIKEIEQRLQNEQKKIQKYLNIIEENVITSSIDLEGKITYVSNAFCKISGYLKEELINQDYKIFIDKNYLQEEYEELWKSITTNKTWCAEIKNTRKDESTYWVSSTISTIFDDNQNKIGYTIISQDISNKKIIEKLSITDGLTDIYNRRYFNEQFPKFISMSKRKNEIVCFMILDIDYFKQYNDTYGHQMGDKTLISVASKIKNNLKRANDYCFRLGGEEFGILLKLEDSNDALLFANTLREDIEALQIEHQKSSVSRYITVSIGLVCEYAKDIESIEEIYKKADDELYKAKKNGRNRVQYL